MDFKSKTLNQIRLWAWAAVVLPITALAGIFFIWRFFDGSILSMAIIVGEIMMFTIAVIWWWWIIFKMKTLVKHWDETKENVRGIVKDVKDMKSAVLEVLSKDK